MMMHRVWFVPMLLPIALSACGAPADGDPFREGTPAAGAPSAAPATNQTPSIPPALPGASPAPPSASSVPSVASPPPVTPAEDEASGALPITQPEDPLDDSGDPGDTPAPAAEPDPDTAPDPEPAPTACASYETGFLPLVHEPVCSRCHTSGRGLPQFEPYAQAQGRCAQIGRLVAAGEMPPGGGLSAAQRAIVASWVSLDCPETAAAAAAVCAPGNTSVPDPVPEPPAADDADDDDDGEDDEDDD